MPLQFWFDFASTYSYPAVMRIEAVAAAHRIEIEWDAFLLGPIFKAQGWDDSPFNIYPIKGRYMWRDLERICESAGIPFRRPSVFPRNSVLAARIATRFRQAPWLKEFVKAVYRANFVDGSDIGDRSVIAQCLRGIGSDSERIIAQATDRDSKALFRAQTERAIQSGIFGAPSFVSNGELFWGNDRLQEAIEWHARIGSISKTSA
jgi:2-hydroxychromene-2-carboxylate isomerase